MYDYRTKRLEQLNRETHTYNTVGNHHHHSNTGIKHPTNFSNLNRETFAHRNGISVQSIYESYGRQW